MKTFSFKTYIYGLLAGVLVLSSCKSGDNNSNFFLMECRSGDSIIEFYKENKNQLPRNFLGDARFRLSRYKNGVEADKIQTFYDSERSKGGFSEIDEAYYNLGQGVYWLFQDTQKTIAYLRKVPESLVAASDSLSLAYNNILGQYYFQVNNLELSLTTMQKAFSAAMELGDTIEMGRMATNLGGINSILGFEKAASEYLLRAQSYDPNNLILANNLASVLTGQKQFKKAKEILERFKEFLTNENPNPDHMVYRLTYVHLLQEMGLWEDSKTYLTAIDINALSPVQHYNYYSFHLLQREHDNSQDLNAYMDSILYNQGSAGYSELFYYLSGWSTRAKMKRIRNHFSNHMNALDTTVFDLMSLSVYFDILGESFEKQGNLIKASQMKTKSVGYLKDHYAEKLESQETDLSNRLQLFVLERRYAKTKLESESVALRLKLNNIILFSGTLLLGVISFAFVRQNRLKARNESLSLDLFRQKQSELELLERERETSKKLVELSSRILDTSKELKMKLVNLPEKNLPGIRESLEDLDYILFLNKSVDTTVIAKGYDFTKVAFLSDLIDSQRQVLSLSLDNYRPKEIAVTLNLSYSYVRNVQSRLRKKLKDEGYETFEALKAVLEA